MRNTNQHQGRLGANWCLIASLAGLWAFTWTAGWIVRGFMGASRAPEAIGDGTRGAISSLWSPDKRPLIIVALVSIVIGCLTLVGSKFLDRTQKERFSTLALTGQQETIKIVETREAKEAVDRERELAEFRRRNAQEVLAADRAAGFWILNLSSYPDARNAKAYLQELARAGIPAFLETVNYSNGSRTFVYGGPFLSEESAQEGSNHHRSFFGFGGQVVKRNGQSIAEFPENFPRNNLGADLSRR